MKAFTRILFAAALALLAWAAQAQEAVIRKNLGERIARFQQIEGIAKSPIPGLYEVWINRGEGVEMYYSDAQGNMLIQGSVLDTKLQRNLTEERVMKLSAINFDSLVTKDAITIVRGNGKRQLAIFEDPNCGYCKQFEAGLQKVDNVTIYLFLFPILGPDSGEKSKNIWCSKDPGKTWTDWMVRSQAIGNAATPSCDVSAIARNVAFGRKHNISGTPTLLFADGSRVPGAISAAQVEKYLSDTR